MKRVILFIITLLISSSLLAANSPKLYEVELVVFTQINSDSFKAEHWPANPGLANLQRTVLLTPPLSLTDYPDKNLQALLQDTQAYQELPPESFSLGREIKRLDKNARYKVLLHTAWLQPESSNKKSISIQILGGQAYDSNGNPLDIIPPTATPPSHEDVPSDFGPTITNQVIDLTQTNDNDATPAVITDTDLANFWEVEGAIKITMKRYFTASVDLNLNLAKNLLPDVKTRTNEKALIPNFLTVRMVESSRMRSNELTYLDNPLFGVLLKITPFQLPTPASE